MQAYLASGGLHHGHGKWIRNILISYYAPGIYIYIYGFIYMYIWDYIYILYIYIYVHIYMYNIYTYIIPYIYTYIYIYINIFYGSNVCNKGPHLRSSPSLVGASSALLGPLVLHAALHCRSLEMRRPS